MSNKSVWWLALLGVLFACVPAWSQPTVNSVRIVTAPVALDFYVDCDVLAGEHCQPFHGAADLLWPANSKHIVTAYDQVAAGIKYVFGNIDTNLGTPKSQPITADPALKSITLTFDVKYALTLGLVDCPDPNQSCYSSATVYVNGTPYERKTVLWLAPGSAVEAQAFPKSGYIFTGWGLIHGVAPPPTSFIIKFILISPETLTAMFQPAAPINVSIQTVPANLEVLADRTPYKAPVGLQWGWGTTHALGAEPIQYDDYHKLYVFDSWSDGGPINHDFLVPSQSTPVSITARFVPGATLTFLTSPPGLTLNVDNRQNWPSYNFVWAGGTAHTVSAPTTQTDAQGRKYRFVSWSNAKSATFTYTVAQPPADDRVTAVYEPLGQVTVASTPAGLSFQVDRTPCVTPCVIERAAGTQVQIIAPPAQSVSDTARMVFQGWGDTNDTTRTVVASADSRTYTAVYRLQNRLALASQPSQAAAFQTTPPSVDGFYDMDTPVLVTANVAPGFRILSWLGDLSGKSASARVILSSPKAAVLQLDPVPELAPLGVRNAAVHSSSESVAPGSLISIFGASLAPDLVSGPFSPLVQTLDNVTVRMDGRLLPLLFVSPGQINAQLVSNLEPGAHTLTVRWEGKPETSTQVSVARNAPGLFSNDVQGRAFGVFVRDNGEAITPDRPVHPGETVRVLATGLGPYQQTPPDGFLFDESAGYTLVDSIAIVLGDDTYPDVLYAGRSGMGVAVDAVKFTVPAIPNASELLPVRIRVQGQDSNLVLLPFEQK